METEQQQTFEEYLKANWERGVIDFRVCCYNDGTFFYIHPLGKDGETPNYRACGNTLSSADNSLGFDFDITRDTLS